MPSRFVHVFPRVRVRLSFVSYRRSPAGKSTRTSHEEFLALSGRLSPVKKCRRNSIDVLPAGPRSCPPCISHFAHLFRLSCQHWRIEYQVHRNHHFNSSRGSLVLIMIMIILIIINNDL